MRGFQIADAPVRRGSRVVLSLINQRAFVGSKLGMKCYSLLLGARTTPGGAPRFSAADDDRLRTITFRHFPDGFTILNADGGWFDPRQKRFIEEQSRQILVCATHPRKLRAWCEELARALEQKELLVVEHGRAATFRLRPKKSPRKRIRSRAPSR